eukprot:CAMPEP_0119201324 /NCGR_PEP_ID=MMETSP1316-20130426/28778_1 /TAXON_ID=41880 /ORGANISM="Pycnococcus provasolii, Strain RCC2336" /LENGTH=94 /DNA_ID=CAMNT_0007197431 /DNA_START=74 /DNA_END=358 /DNA_ORIENTATION=+
MTTAPAHAPTTAPMLGIILGSARRTIGNVVCMEAGGAVETMSAATQAHHANVACQSLVMGAPKSSAAAIVPASTPGISTSIVRRKLDQAASRTA